MAARPNPLSALKLCQSLAKNSRRRLEATVECAEAALETNVRLTAAERAHYTEAIAVAKKMLAPFTQVTSLVLPKAPPKVKRRIGRPSQREIARAEATRRV
jgi:hypothetical protein